MHLFRARRQLPHQGGPGSSTLRKDVSARGRSATTVFGHIRVCYPFGWNGKLAVNIDDLSELLQMRCLFFCGLTLAVTTTLCSAQSQSPNGVIPIFIEFDSLMGKWPGALVCDSMPLAN